ncbi:hypothetical protein [Oenococcus oeni]|uniref:hypothetical protein n=1 Tax=Oenococcus oeni TaxID=1247 RepID=UPI0002E7FE7D|nr:hypothetical protein [Oenococcus oeni]
MSDWVLNDTIPDALTLDPDSFVLTDNDTGKALIQGPIIRLPRRVLVLRLNFSVP